MTLDEPFEFVDGDLRIVVPADFTTDFNSVPRLPLLWTWFPPWECPEAAVVHDYGYARNPGGRERLFWDHVHRRIMAIKGERRSSAPRCIAASDSAGGWLGTNTERLNVADLTQPDLKRQQELLDRLKPVDELPENELRAGVVGKQDAAGVSVGAVVEGQKDIGKPGGWSLGGQASWFTRSGWSFGSLTKRRGKSK